jgi:NAD(P)-dependent dehydrogenase (short-subunit alcohol dehydrogenase family)
MAERPWRITGQVSMQFSGKIALVTSGDRGIRREITLRLAAEGAFVGVDDGSASTRHLVRRSLELV